MTSPHLRFQLLGSFQLLCDGAPVHVGGPTAQAVLVALLHPPDTKVLPGRIMTDVWGESNANALDSLHHYIAQLRRALAPAGLTIRGHRPGYQLTVARESVDAVHFEDLVNAGRRLRDTDPQEAARRFRTALDLWRGPEALDNLTHPGARRLAQELEAVRLDTEEHLAELELAHGDPHRVVHRVRPLVAVGPGHGGLVAVLMRALHAAGRTQEALDICQQAERHARDQGLTPSHHVRQAQQDILRDRRPTIGWKTTSPFQPPADSRHFIGRISELTWLRGLWPDDGSVPDTVVVAVISGMPGLGKTTLAVRAAHRLAGRFPDGVLFLDLHGFTPDTEPTTASAALDALLRSLGVPGDRIRGDLAERAALYRSVLAGRRVLVVLDNAAEETQVRPLLPGAPGCLVLITSRRRLARLDDAHHLSLTTLSRIEAVDLFRAGAGDRAASEHHDIEQIVDLCGNLPLAIRIAAARLRVSTAMTPATLLARLRLEKKGNRLAWLDDGERSVAAAIAVSDQHLTADQQRAFRVLGLAPGPSIDPHAAAALTGRPVDQARQLLEGLEEVNLLGPGPVPGHWAFHDFTRDYATLMLSEDGEAERRDALTRLFDYYRHTASVAADMCYPEQAANHDHVPESAAVLPPLDDPVQAETWLDAELPNLLAAAAQAASHGWPSHTSHLSAALAGHLRNRARHGDAETLLGHELVAARHAGDHAGERHALTGLGETYGLMGRYESAGDHYRKALELARASGDRQAECHGLAGLGTVCRATGDYERAVEYYEQALGVARDLRDGPREGYALTGLGDTHLMLGRYPRAEDRYQQALTCFRTCGDRRGECHVLVNLGTMRRIRGRHERAARYHRQALDLARELRDRSREGYALAGLGTVYRQTGDHDRAAECYQQALDLARELRDRYGETSALAGLAGVLVMMGHYEQAAEHYQRALDIARWIGGLNGMFEALYGLGELSRLTGHAEHALTHHCEALDIAGKLKQRHDQARAHQALAQDHEALNQPDQVRLHKEQASRIFADLGVPGTD